jgi:hypothetical protein
MLNIDMKEGNMKVKTGFEGISQYDEQAYNVGFLGGDLSNPFPFFGKSVRTEKGYQYVGTFLNEVSCIN